MLRPASIIPLVSAQRQGNWPRRLVEDQELAAAADKPPIDRTRAHPCVGRDAAAGSGQRPRPWGNCPR
ncbi:hypothetical protein ACWGK6_14115 [Streptomyces violaceusniger]|uniref:hypothetical protein n=1 Tax=Streptomyces violaceusniger TaxID=68280 RepID=UPI00380B822D